MRSGLMVFPRFDHHPSDPRAVPTPTHFISFNEMFSKNGGDICSVAAPKVDSLKRPSEIKRHPLFEVDFPPFYAQNERNLSEFNLAKMVRGWDLNPRPCGDVAIRSRTTPLFSISISQFTQLKIFDVH
jgi:hypothetical protein